MQGPVIGLGYNILAVLVPALCAVLIEFICRKLGSEKIQKIQAELHAKQDLAGLAVRMAEQVYQDLHGEEKYNKAAEWLESQAKQRGIIVTSEEIKGLIEAAVRMAKDEFGEQWAKSMV